MGKAILAGTKVLNFRAKKNNFRPRSSRATLDSGAAGLSNQEVQVPVGDGTVRKKWKRLLLVFGALLLWSCVGAYVALSRRGYTEADRYHMKEFYYFLPQDSDAWRVKNYGCVCLFGPLNVLDRWLGLGAASGF
jgi:hypothetical protein